ncbi:MAG: RecB-family nuclease [Desulfurococcaceae archaeon]
MCSIYIALYSPSSVQKLLDFIKTIYIASNLTPVVIKPFGAAAQIGVPEAHRLSYKMNKPLIILPEIKDLKQILGCSVVYYISEEGVEIDLTKIFEEATSSKIAIVVNSGEQEPSRKELEDTVPAWFKSIPRGFPPVSLTGVIVYEYYKSTRSN